MSTAMLERIDTDVETELDEGDDLDHIICHCNMDKGWCGAEVALIIGEVGELIGNDCEECELLALQYVLQCPYGCTCTESMRLLNCGADEEDEDE